MTISRVPVQDPARQTDSLQCDLEAAASRVLRSGWYLGGNEVAEFEREFAVACGAAHCVAVASGTDALELGLRALGCRAGDEVITVANAGMYATTACLQIGATPVFADVDGETLQMSADSVAGLISPRTHTIVVTHLYGKMANVASIRMAVKGRQVSILEDCAQAHGASTAGQRAGSLGHAAAFSFYPTKNLGALGDAGAVVTSDHAVADRARLLRQYGWDARFHSTVPFGRNSRMDELQAAFLRVKLPHLDGWNDRRRAIVRQYRESARGTGLRFLHQPDSDFVAHLCVGLHPDREEARRRLDLSGIDTAIHYPVADHHQPALREVNFLRGDLSTTESVLRDIFTLPCFPELDDHDVDRICESIRHLP